MPSLRGQLRPRVGAGQLPDLLLVPGTATLEKAQLPRSGRGYEARSNNRWALCKERAEPVAQPATFYPLQRLGHKGGDQRGLAFEQIARARGRMLVLAMHTAPQAYPAPANRHSTALKRWRTYL
jgi:hypothetical protein